MAKAIQACGEQLTRDARCRLVAGGDVSAIQKGSRKRGQAQARALLQIAREAKSGILCTRTEFLGQVEAAVEAVRLATFKRSGYDSAAV